jgi:hypothetical protein
MVEEFVPYELALRMKQLGFDEPCFSYYELDGRLSDTPKESGYDIKYQGDCKFDNHQNTYLDEDESCSAPLYQQAFRWFRDEHGMSGSIQIEHDAYQWSIYEEGETSGLASDNWDGTDYEEAELACLEKLIEIVESKSE